MTIENITSLDLGVLFNPILHFGFYSLAILGAFTLLIIVFFLIYSHKNINVFVNQNNRLIDKYPLVSEIFMKQPLREQNIENNQELHEHRKEIDEIKESLSKIVLILEELRKNG